MEMLIGGMWRPAASGRAEEVTSPFDGAVAGTVPVAGPEDVRAALGPAARGSLPRAADQHLHRRVQIGRAHV